MDAKYLSEIKKRCDAATPGPWEYSPAGHIYRKDTGLIDTVAFVGACGNQAVRDTAFIAHSREDVPALIAEVERLQHKLDEIHKHDFPLLRAVVGPDGFLVGGYSTEDITKIIADNGQLKEEIRLGQHMCAPIELDADSGQAFVNAVEMSKLRQEAKEKDRQIADLKRMLAETHDKHTETHECDNRAITPEHRLCRLCNDEIDYEDIDLCSVCIDMMEDIANRSSSNRLWIPVSERPKQSGSYLVHNDMNKVNELDLQDYHREVEIMYYSVFTGKWATNSIVTHFMPLPEPPKDGD